jgi:cardiolipin synthase
MKKHIPNILSVIRLALVPVFIYVFLILEKRAWALFIFALASATDILDGYLARKYGWITQAGKLLDPIADKLMQAAVICCITVKNSFFIWIAVLFLLKESAMGIGSLIVIRKKHDIAVSSWYGKAATVAFFFITAVFIIKSQNELLNIILGALLSIVLITAFLLYYFKVFRGIYGIKWRNKAQK